MVAIRDHGRARQALPSAEPHLRGDLIAEEADHAGSGQHPKMRDRVRVDETLNRLVERHARGDKDRKNDGESCQLLAAKGAKKECDPERDCCQCVAEDACADAHRDGREHGARADAALMPSNRPYGVFARGVR